jgi:hypothetical protein
MTTMTTAVHKYPVLIADIFEVSMPQGARPLCVQLQGGKPCLWARVTIDPSHPIVLRWFRLVGTGHPIETDLLKWDGEYVGTFQLRDGALVYHVFDCGEG